MPATPNMSPRDLRHLHEAVDTLTARLTAPFHRLADAAELTNTINGARRLEARDLEPEVMLVRHLDIRHLGCWVYLPGHPAKGGPATAAEPSIVVMAGRLVGFRGGKPGSGNVHATRVLVIQQGSAQAEFSVSVADRVDVAPREW